MKRFVAASMLFVAATLPASAQGLPPLGGPYPPPFIATLSNNVPLAYGMDADQSHLRARRAPQLCPRPSG